MARKPDFPPHPVGRLVASRRYSVLADFLPQDIHPDVKFYINNLNRDYMSRSDLADIANLTLEKESNKSNLKRISISEEDITKLERDGKFNIDDKIYWILRATLIPHADALSILENLGRSGSISTTTLKNVHLVDGPVAFKYAEAEFGPLMNAATVIRGLRTTWVDVVTAGPGGFREDELRLKCHREPKCIRPHDPDFQSVALKVARHWKESKSSTDDNPSLALKHISVNKKPDFDERPILNIDFVRSSYRYNTVAKGPDGARFRWEQLQEQDDPKDPLVHLSSGIGVAINVVCVRDNKIAIGQRLKVNFRRNEFDVAAVEGIRPTADVNARGHVDLFSAVKRALDEEVGLKHAVVALKREPAGIIEDIKILGFGVDLRYYQYNFLCTVKLDVSFSDLQNLWTHAPDRHENRKMHPLENSVDSAMEFVKSNNIWSSGIAALVKSFDFP